MNKINMKNNFAKASLAIGFSVGIPLLFIIFRALPIGSTFSYVMVGIPILFVIWGGTALWSIANAIKYFRVRQRFQFFTALVPPIIFACALLNPFGLLHSCQDAGDILHFLVMRSAYMVEISKLPSNYGPKLVVFNTGGMTWASGGYVYDDSDEVLLPIGRQSANWLDRASKTELACQGYSVRPFLTGFSLSKHFYLANFTC